MQFITIKESHYESDLTILKSRLEAEGIRCRFKDEYTTQVLSHLSTMSVELQVANYDLEKAIEIMKESGEKVPESAIVYCPKCDSDNVSARLNLKGLIRIVALFFSSLFTFKSVENILKSANLKCKTCGFEFRVSD
jgi:predicted Zn-ribbon and HTH transcriptional regulator